MSDGDVDTSCSADTSYESSMVSKPPTPGLVSTVSSASRPTSSMLMYNFLNYEPTCRRKCSKLTFYSFYTSFVYLVCRSIGIGCLYMPYAFERVGMVVALALCVMAGLTFTYSVFLLCRYRHKICLIRRVPTVSYQDLIEHSLAQGPRVISYFSIFFRRTFIAMNLVLNFGTSCLYMKFVSLTIQELFDEVGVHANFMNICLSYTVICLVFLSLPSDMYLGPFRILGHMACTVFLLFFAYHKYTTDIHVGSQTLVRGDWTDVFQFFGILLFSFVPIVQVLQIEDKLNKQDGFVRPNTILNTSMVVMTNIYIAIGLCGYLEFQEVSKIEFPLLEAVPTIRSRTIVKSCVAANIAFAHRQLCVESVLLLLSSSIRAAKVQCKKKDRRPTSAHVSPSVYAGLTAAYKILFTICSFLVSVAVVWPVTSGFQSIIALVGYLGNACNILVYPYLVELCLTHALYDMSARPLVVVADLCFIVVGLSVFACGTFAVVTRIIHDCSN